MDEPTALAVTAARALETADPAHELWSDADRAWASRAAAEVVGAGATAESFAARRAMLVLERGGARHGALARAVGALRWRPWVGVALVVLAFVAGAVVDYVGGGRRINVLAPPALLLIGWNLAAYMLLIAAFVVRYGDATPPGPLRRALVRVAGGAVGSQRGAIGDVLAALAAAWAQLSKALYGARAARLVHLAAAALALGVIAGFYLRGLAFDYQASWESTFLDPPAVRDIVAIAYAPGAALTGIAVPTVEAIAAIRAPAGENAARWLHLIAATLLLLVVVPRLALALVAGLFERHRAQHLPVDLEAPYFQRLLRGFRTGPARVRVLPYSYTPPPECVAGLEAIVTRSFGSNASVALTATIAYGSDEPLPGDGGLAATTLALFNATATPEREVHGVFLKALRARGGALVALVDDSALRERLAADASAVFARRAAWAELADDAQVPLVVATLVAPDLAAAGAALDAALDARVVAATA